MTSIAPITKVAKRVASLTAALRETERRYQRPPGSVSLLAVSKGQGADAICKAYGANLRHFGESYVQEAQTKMDAVAEMLGGSGDSGSDDDSEIVWHFIGPLQANKTRGVASRFHWVHSVDREKLARRLSQQRPSTMPSLNVCVQMRLSRQQDEPAKSGAAEEQLPALCDLVATLPGLHLRGLMGIPAAGQDRAGQRAAFRRLAQCFAAMQARHPSMDTLSMGMSGDFDAAIAEGATLVRLGTALFGPRAGQKGGAK